MHIATSFDSTAITHDLQRKYADDYEACSYTMRNCYINPSEYKCVDAPASPVHARAVVETMQTTSPQSDSSVQSPVLLGQPTQVYTQTQARGLDESESEDDLEDEEIDGTPCLEMWTMALTHSEDGYMSDSSQSSNGISMTWQQDLEEDDAEEEDDCEVQADPLPSLPNVNVRDCPQEDIHYLCKKRYCCNDKYDIGKLLEAFKGEDGVSQLPSTMSLHTKQRNKPHYW